MQFFRSIKSAKALGLAVATTVTLISTNIAPTVAQLPSGGATAVSNFRVLTFSSLGTFNANLTVLADGQPTFNSGSIPFGQTIHLDYRAGTKIQVIIKAEGRTKTLHQSSFTINDNTCFRTIGTTFNPAVVRC